MEGQKIVSFNCNGFKKRNFHYLLHLYKNYDILLLQETWLYNFQFDTIQRILPDSQFHATSAMDESMLGRVGRPFGGCAIIWNGKKLSMSVSPVTVNNPRVCAVQMYNETTRLLLISVYMPTSTTNDNSRAANNNVDNNNDLNAENVSNTTNDMYDNNVDYGETLSHISSLINQYPDYDIIIGGDFNVDFSRQSRHLNLASQFLSNEDLLNLTTTINHNITYTYKSPNHHRSLIDHFFVNETVNNLVQSYYTIDDGRNLSDHLPIFLHTSISCRRPVTPCTNDEYRLDWESASDVNIKHYNLLIYNRLQNITIPDQLRACNSLVCKEHGHLIMSILSNISEILIECANLAIPSKKIKNKSNCIPGWNEFVRPYRETAIFWHDIWKSLGRKPDNHLASVRRLTRAKYHWAIKQVKANTDNIIRAKTASLLQRKSFTQFWNVIKNINKSVKSCPSVVDDQNTDLDIAKLFSNNYGTLFNSFNDSNLDKIEHDVNELVKNKCMLNKCPSHKNNSESGTDLTNKCYTVTPELIAKCIRQLKSGKSDDTYDISSDHIKNASAPLHNVLSFIFTAMLQHGCSDTRFNASVIKPIPKNKNKSQNDSSNYRAIAINSIFSKLLDYIILNLIEKNIDSSHLQFAYKKEYSTSLCSFLVVETIQYYRSRGSNVLALLLDATKAFDRVKYSKLFNNLIDRDVCPVIIRLIINMYKLNSAIVNWNGTKSQSFPLTNGVKQGGVISPLLFAVYLDPLLDKLHKTKKGCFIGNICANALAYADDVILLTPTCAALIVLISICEEYSREVNLQFNPNKCILLVFTDSDVTNDMFKIEMFNKIIPVKLCEKHLGHMLSTKGPIVNFDDIIRSIKVRTNIVTHNFYSISHKSKSTLFNSQCLSLYGCPIWDLQNEQYSTLCKTWRVCCRQIMNLSNRTRSYLIPSIMDTLPIDYIVKERMLNFFVKGLNHSDSNIANFFKNCLLSCSSYTLTNINDILNTFDIKYCDMFNMSKNDIRKSVRKKTTPQDWRGNIINELLYVLDGELNTNLDTNETKDILRHVCTH